MLVCGRLNVLASSIATTIAVATLVGCAGLGEDAPPEWPGEESQAASTNSLIPILGPAAPPVTVSGRGPARRRFPLGEGPLIVSGRFEGSGRAYAELAAEARVQVLLFDAPAPLAGERAVWWLDAGPYNLRVRASGAWRLTFTAWRPNESDRALEGVFSGEGPAAVPVRVEAPSPTSVAVEFSGRGPFSVLALPFSPYSEDFTLAETRRGPVDDRFRLSIAPGDYLMQVHALGAWRLTFAN